MNTENKVIIEYLTVITDEEFNERVLYVNGKVYVRTPFGTFECKEKPTVEG